MVPRHLLVALVDMALTASVNVMRI
jgi:hypothetical protein